MFGEKKHRRKFSTPFQRFSGPKQDLQKIKVGSSGSQVSNVYLSNDASPSGFIIVPEFDYPVQTHTTFEAPNDNTHLRFKLPAATPHRPWSPNSYPTDRIGSQRPYLARDSRRADDLTQRLDLAYEHIRCSMPHEALPEVHLSSDPQMLRKQLGVPQHSVFNYPLHSSPDLPNPHVSPCEPSSPEWPPATLDGSYARQSEEPSSCFNMPNTVSSRHRLQNPVQPRAQSESIMSTQSPAENITSSAIASPSRPRSYSNCRAEKTIFLSSPPPPPRRQALKGFDMSPRQILLPQMRRHTPYKVDTSVQFHTRNHRQASRSTEVLASLATPLSAGRHSAISPLFPERHSMEIVAEEGSTPDDILVYRLKRARRTNNLSEPARDPSPSRSSSSVRSSITKGDEDLLSPPSSPPSSPPISNRFTKSCDVLLSSPTATSDTTTESEDVAIWQTTRKAILCTREIIRTEKKYLEALRMLLSAQTVTPPPPSMSSYILALVQVSEMLLEYFLEDPSAWGVSVAFVTSEDELEATLVSWCAVAGTFFTDGNNTGGSTSTRWRLRKSGVMSGSASKRVSISPSPQPPTTFSLITATSKVKEGSAEECQKKPLVRSTYGQVLTSQSPCRKPSVRDLAIQPIQRVMRYVLLFRDLLDCTPVTSPPHLFVERALETATRIANNCDKAQRNPAFCHASS